MLIFVIIFKDFVWFGYPGNVLSFKSFKFAILNFAIL